ncbi:MAG: hypothetical protein IAF08_08110 [Rhizobacter sp.]|nr:hypothetical protein [Chlorobiales bacterium]
MNTYQSLTSRLTAVYHKGRLKLLTLNAAKLFAAIALLVLIFSLIETFLHLPGGGRLALLIALMLGSLVTLGLLLYPFIRSAFQIDAAALAVGAAFPGLRDRLLNAVQIYHDHLLTPNPFAEAELERLSTSTAATNFSDAVSFDDLKKPFIVAGAIVLLTTVLFAALPSDLGHAFYRITHFSEDFTPPPPFEIVSLSKDVDVAKGSDAVVTFKLRPLTSSPRENSVTVRRLSLQLRDKDGLELQEVKLFADSAGVFQHRLRNQKSEMTYFAIFDPTPGGKVIESKTHRITVTDKPSVASFQLSLTPPAYTRLAAQRLDENFGDATAIAGTKVFIKLKATEALEAARLLTGDTLIYLMNTGGDSATLRFTLTHDLNYRFALLGRSGIPSEKSPEYQLRVTGDDVPEISFLQPIERRTDLPQSMTASLALKVRDDYGFQKLRLKYRVSKSADAASKEFSELPLPVAAAELEQTVFYTWDLKPLVLGDGDEVEFYAEVTDNDAVSGFKAARTETYSLRLPGVDELFADVDLAEKAASEALEKSLKESEALQKQLEQLSGDLKQKPKLDWQDKKQMESALAKSQELLQKSESASEKLQEAAEKMAENQLVSPETLEKYQELQKMFDELASKEMKDAAEKLQQSMQQMNERQVREALKNFSMNEEQLKKTLERTSELLKRLQIEKKFDELSKRLESMEQKQAEVQKETSQQNPDNQKKLNDLQKDQQKLTEAQKNFEQQMKDLEQKMQAFPKAEKMPLQDLDKLREQQKQDNVEKDSREAEKKLGEREPQEASQKQQQASQKMQKQQQSLAEMKQSMQRQKKQEVIEAVKNAVQSSLELSKMQEELRQESQQNQSSQQNNQSGQNTQREQASQQQQLLQSLQQLQDNMQKAGKKSADVTRQMSRELGKAQQQMQDAIAQMENRQGGAEQNMAGAMQSLNQFADGASKMLSQMMGPNKGGQQPGEQGEGGEDGEGEDGEGFQKGMKSLSDQQGDLNQQTEGAMREQGQGKGERLSQLAAQQRLIQQQLQQLAREQQQRQQQQQSDPNKSGNGAGGKPLGNMDKVAEEMEEAAKQLEQQKPSRELVKRQQQILSRMLESTKSLKEREKEERREANTGKNLSKKSPAEVSLEAKRSRLQEAINKLREQGYSEEYEKLIRRYFEQLEKQPN